MSTSPAKPRILTLEVTAYCACKKCCGSRAQGLTATGKPITYNGGHFVAADKKLLPYGTKLIVPGYNDDKPVEVIDRGGAIKGYHIDLFMPTHEQAVEWGKRWLQVRVVDEAALMQSEAPLKNPKSESRNPNQIRMTKIRTAHEPAGHE